ncbi:hypothetical protein HYU40_00980 [Candidatus Woesearchaeota archaeon]|nr:hypothetical protein [Candidatus Woesearchaeota archaeon]
MAFNIKDIDSEYRVLHGENGKRYYALSMNFWRFIRAQFENREFFKTRRDLVRYIIKLTKGEITQRAVEGWVYRNRKPLFVKKLEPESRGYAGCKHGFVYFCALCNLNATRKETCPVNLFWITHPQGKAYVYEKYWKELKYQVDNALGYGLLLSQLYPKVSTNSRTIRSWKNNKNLPKLFSDDEFSFSKHNLYFLGLYLSDGHIRNNGSPSSFTYQTGSSDIFQGYWCPQFIQRFFPIFENKANLSNTYLTNDTTYGKPALKTNLSSVSPIFIKKLIQFGLIMRRNSSNTSGYKKNIPLEFLKAIGSYHEYFQGIFDGDGTYGSKGSPLIDLATSPETDYTHLIAMSGLIPTLSSPDKRHFVAYSKLNQTSSLYMIRFAPASLRRMAETITAGGIVRQLNFFVEAAENSIRPDKVHKLIKIVKVITSSGYGESNNSHEIQREIRALAVKSKLREKAEQLAKQFIIKNGKYQPFMPKWAEGLCSKKEAWGFFFNKENLVCKIKDNGLMKKDFSEGIPVDFVL